MDIRLVSGSYKSIIDFEWLNVPMFAVVAGLNGSGKTQMLECIGQSAGVNINQEGRENSRFSPPMHPVATIEIIPSLTHENVVFLRSSWPADTETASLDSVTQQANEVWNWTPATGQRWQSLWSIIESRLKKERRAIGKEEFLRALPANFMMLAKGALSEKAGIPSLFVSYLHTWDILKKEGRTEEQIHDELGPLPWEILNNIFERANLQYRVVQPILQPPARFSPEQISYTLKLQDVHTGTLISPSDLSAGEKVMFGVALWFFSFSHKSANGADDGPQRLLLLDEPDAHLHPSLARGFLDVIRSELVDKHGIRVIMTTHSPSTIAFTDNSQIFVMSRTSPRIVQAVSKWDVLSKLTAGFLTIGLDSKCTFVEDDDDRVFYTTVQTMLSAPKSGLPSLDPLRSILFISSSRGHPGEGKGNPSGGMRNVEKWVAAIVSSQIAGIIDLDNGNTGSERVHVLQRHSLESYLLDPLFLYSILLENVEAPAVPGVNLSVHDARNLLGEDRGTLQAIIDVMLAEFRSLLVSRPSQQERVLVQYHNGPQLFLDRWFVETSMKVLFEPLKKRFNIKFDRQSLIKQYHLAGIVPDDLVQMLRKIQRA